MPGVTASTLPIDVPYKQLTDQNPNGTQMGANASDKIAFFGATPIVQPTGPGEAAVVRGQGGASIGTIASNVASPTSILTITTTEKSITLLSASSTYAIAAGDLLYVNKPTSQAGLGVGNVRVSAANTLGITFSNYTGSTITPTASQKYAVVALRGFGNISAVLTPAAVPPNTTAEQQFAVTGIRSGSKALVQVNKPTAQAGLDIAGCRVVSDNVLGITFLNVTAATITPTAGETYLVFEMAGIDSLQNNILVESLQSPATIATVTTAEQGFTVTGVLASDVTVGVSKPTAQAGIGIAGWRTSAADTIGVTFINPTAGTLTPTASEEYAIQIYRQAPAAPLVVYNQSLAPTSVAANTTAEQTFTVTGLVVNSPVWVNKPSATPGLGIVGVRVSAANTLAINFGNSSAAAIVPPTENYVIGNFQLPIGDAGSAWVQGLDPAAQNDSITLNSMRAAMVSLGLIAGA